MRNPPWSTSEAVLAIIFLVPLTVLVSGLFHLLSVIVLRLLFQPAPSNLSLISTGVGSFLASVGLVWLFGVKKYRATPGDIGFNGLKMRLDLPLAVLGQVTAFVGMATYTIFLRSVLGLRVPEQLSTGDFGASASGFAFAFLIIVVLAPFGEEMFFRGFVYQAFRRQWGVGWGMVATSGIFAIFHLHPLLFVPMFIIGMVLAVLFEYRGTLAPSIILHALNNLMALLAVYGLL